MPDEDQNIGTSTEVSEATPLESTQQESSSTQESPSVESQAPENTEAEAPAVSAPPLENTIGAALDAFKKEKNTGTPQFPGKAAPAAPPVRQARDYSGLTPEEVAWFKKMDNQAFNALKPQYLEFKKLKTEHETLKQQYDSATKTTFFEQEGAYKLTPEYEHLSSNVNLLDAEISHWEEQLGRIAAGEQWIPIELDSKGNPVLGAPRDASSQAQGQVVAALTKANVLRSDISGKLSSLQDKFTTQHKGFVTKLAEVEKDIFKGGDPKALDAAMRTKLPLFPQHLHNNPLVQSLAKAAAVIEGLVLMLNQQQSAAATSTIKARTAANAGPRAGEVQPGTVKGEKVGSILDEFHKGRAMGYA